MAIIYSYPEVTSLQVTDRFIISRFPASSGDISNYSLDVDTLATFITARVNLNFLGDAGTGIINLDTQNLTVSGTANEIETSASSQTLQIGLPSNVTITNNLTIGGNAEVTGELDVAGAVRLGFTGNDPVILGNPAGKRTEWNNPGYFEIYAENPDVPGDFNETIDIDGEFLGGGYIGVYPVRTEDKHGVRMHSRDSGGIEANFIDIASVESSAVYDEDQIRLVTTADSLGTYAGIKVLHPTDNRFRFNSDFNIEPTVPFLVNTSAKFTGQVTIPLNPVSATDAASKGYVDGQNQGQVTGNGPANTIAMFTTDGTTIGDSPLTNPSFDSLETTGSLQLGQYKSLSFGDISNANRLLVQNGLSGSQIRQSGSGDLLIQCESNIELRAAAAIGGTEALAKFKENGPIELYYDNVKTFETSSTGVAVTGAQSSFSGQVTIPTTPVAATDAASKAYVDANSGGGGDTYDLNAGTKSGNSVPLNLTSGSGTDNSLVNLTEGSNVQLTQTSTNEITISSTGGTVTGAWQTLNRTFTGSELVNAFNGNTTDKITLVTVGANEIVSLGFCTFICKASTTGTTNYINTSLAGALYVIPENTGGVWGVAIDNNLLQSSFQDQVGQNLPGVARSNTSSGNRPVGADLVLGNTPGQAANITQGDRDFIIQITYRITNF